MYLVVRVKLQSDDLHPPFLYKWGGGTTLSEWNGAGNRLNKNIKSLQINWDYCSEGHETIKERR